MVRGGRLFYIIGACIILQAILAIIPFSIALAQGDDASVGVFSMAIVLMGLVGASLFFGFRSNRVQSGPIASVTLSVTALCTIGFFASLPFLFYAPGDGIWVALFEGFSFFTTNGASAYPVALQSAAMHAWRAVLSFQGGFFVICFALSIFTRLNSGGMQLHQSPLPLGDMERGYARILDLAKVFLPLYLSLLAAFGFLFMLAGHGFGQSLSLGISALSTTSLPYLDGQSLTKASLVIMTVAMILGASNWDMLYALVAGRRRNLMKDPEARSFAVIIALAFVFLGFTQTIAGSDFSFVGLIYDVTSAVSGTAMLRFENYDIYGLSPISLGIFFTGLMAAGGAVVGTTGGLKQLRVLSLIALGRSELVRLAHPHGVQRLKVGKAAVSKSDLDAIWLMAGGGILVLILGCLALAISGISLEQAFALAFTNLVLAGSGAELINPGVSGYTALTNLDYFVLTVLMIVGRLETAIVFALFSYRFWNR